ncbi:hypothetical protein HGH93_21375 [Chitinophaga polysaccharea]|uniref:hypothetical protein n=1 Tax=Chitinophaga polysaccharea TaxID=1293035 RepID=UPI0014559349|nr:hypothetical protein [Chitinophaga polysaccharea]NLR60675.1 hypothetical protein [Chitinophaga polysaccharea]
MIDKNILQSSNDLALLQSNYLKGEPVTDYAKSVLDKYKPSAKRTSGLTPFSGTNTPATVVPTGSAGERYPYYSPFVPSNEDLYGAYQSWYSKAGNGILKGAGIALTTFLNGTAGLIFGVGNAIADGKMSSFYDNDFTRSLDSINEYMENQLPNYYSDRERDADWYSPDNLFTANFLFDKVIKNLGFSVGAIGAGLTYSAALRSLGLFSKVASAGGLARTAQLTEEMAATVPQIQSGAATSAGIRAAASEFLTGFNRLNAAQRIVAAGLSTIGEANFEALLQLNDYRKELIADYVQKNGVRPTGEDLEEINRYAENTGNAVFMLNLPLLTATNYIQLPKVLGSSYRAERNLFSSGVREAGQVAFDKEAGKFVSTITKNKFGKALLRTKNVASLFFSPSEAFEELSQTSFNFGVENYYNKVRKGQHPDILHDMLAEGYRKSLTTKEGLESALIGGISGGIFQFRNNLRQRGLDGFGGISASTNKAAIESFNKALFSDFLNDLRGGVNRGAAIQADRMEAIRRGDFVEARDLQTDFTHNYLAPRIKYGRYDLVKDDIDSYRQLASIPQGLQQLKDQGVITDETTSEQLLGRLGNLSAHADHVNDLYQALNIRYSGLKDKDGNRIYPDQVIDKMVYAAAKVSDYDARVSSLSGSLNTFGIAVQPILDEMASAAKPSEAIIQPALDQINNLNILSEEKDSVRDDLRDLLELSLRRKEFLREYEALKGKPQDYIEKKYGPAPSETSPDSIVVPSIDENGNVTDFNLTAGKTYLDRDLVVRRGNSFAFHPTISFNNPSLLGDMWADYSHQDSAYFFPEEINGARLKPPFTELELSALEPQLSDAIEKALSGTAFTEVSQQLVGKSFQEKLKIINDLDSKPVADAVEAAFKTVISGIQQVRDHLSRLTDPAQSNQIDQAFDQADISSGATSTESPQDDASVISALSGPESSKKHISTLFRSSTSENTAIIGTGENDDFHRRANLFLNRIDDIKDRSKLRVAVVTFANQKVLGLDGLIPAQVPGSNVSSTDINEGIIRLVFIRSDAAGDFFVDVNGNNLAAVGTRPDFNHLVYTTMPSTSLTWRNGEERYITTGKRGVTADKAKTYQDAYRIKRTAFFARQTEYDVFPFTVSRGFPTYNKNNKRFAVTQVLVSPDDLNSSLLVIPTHSDGQVGGRAVGSVIHGEETIDLPLGRPVLQRGSVFVPLNNRQLTPAEKLLVKKLLGILAASLSKGGVNRAILDYLQGLVYWKKPVAGKPATKGQIWYQSGYLHLGSETRKIPFLESLVDISPQLDEFLDQVYVSANNYLLTQKAFQPFNEITGVDSSGNIEQIQWKSYQHFLLSDTIVTTVDDSSGKSGQLRAVEMVPFTTDVEPVGNTADKYAAVFGGKYVTLHTLNLFPHASTGGNTNQDVITDEDYKLFVDRGSVSAAILQSIAEKIISKAALSERENAIFSSKTNEINAVIESLAKPNASLPPGAETSAEETEIFEPIAAAGDFVFDGVTMNLITYEGKKLGKVSAVFTEKGLEITGYEHIKKKAATEEYKAVVLEVATVQMNKAVQLYWEQRDNAAKNLATGTAAANEGVNAEGTEEDLVAIFPDEEGENSTRDATREVKPSDNTEESSTGNSTGEKSASEIFKNLRPNNNGLDMTGGRYRPVINTPLIFEDVEKFRKYLAQVLPGVSLQVLKNIIARTDGGFAWGAFADNVIYLYEHAEVGTGYHEVFEAVYSIFLNNRQQHAVVSEFRKRNGSFLDLNTGEQVPYADATVGQAIDGLAEEFRHYNLTGELPAPPAVKGFFRKLLQFIRSLVFGTTLKVSDLFARINQGYYSSATPVTSNIPRDIRYRPIIDGLSTAFIQQVMEAMTAMVFEELFEQNRSLVELDEYNISLKQLYDAVLRKMENHFDRQLPENLLAQIQHYDEDKKRDALERYAQTYNNTWIPIKKNWEKLLAVNESFLKPFNLVFESNLTEEEIGLIGEDQNKSSRDYDREILKISAKKNAATSVKLLFASLTQVENDAETNAGEQSETRRKLSALKLPVLADYSRTFNRFLYHVQMSISPSDMIGRLKELATSDKKYIRLYNRLKTAAGYDNLSVYDWKLLIKLFSVAAKQRPEYLIQIEDENGRAFIADANDNKTTNILIEKWLNNLKATAGSGKLFSVNKQRFQVNTKLLSPFRESVKQLDGKLQFLKMLGIDFTESEYHSLNEANKKKFNSSVQRLYNQLSKSAKVSTISGRGLGITSALTRLAQVFIRKSGEPNESQHFSITGDPVQNLILHNYVSTILNDINYYQNKQELLTALPHLQDTFSESSLLLENGGLIFDENGNRRDDTLNISIIEGSKQVGPKAGIPTDKLSLAKRRLQEFNQNLNAIYYLLLPADSRTEWSLNFQKKHYVTFQEFSNPGALSNKLFRIFKGYLLSELNLISDYDNRAQNKNLKKTGRTLRFMKGILGAELSQKAVDSLSDAGGPLAWVENNRSIISEKIQVWFDGLAQQQFDYFRQYDIIQENADGSFTFKGLDGDFKDDNKIDNRQSLSDLKNLIKFRTINYSIHNTELHKIFFGDPALYTDATKRIKSFLSGRETTYHTDSHFNTFANNHLNRTSLEADGIKLLPADPGYWEFKDHMITATASDVIVVTNLALDETLPTDIRQAYEQANEADAQSWITLPAYRELLLKSAGRWTDAMERQFQYEMAFERWTKAAAGEYSYKGREDLKQHDGALIAAGNPGHGIFHVIKPIGTGIKAGARFADMFLDKTSAMPIYFRMSQGRSLEKIYNQMSKAGLSYLIMESGRKVGAENFHSLYQPTGALNTEVFGNRVLVPFKYFGIQLETAGQKDKQTRGTQLTKLAIINLLASTVPIDTTFSLQEWNSLSEKDRIASSKIYEIVNKNIGILNAMSERGYKQVLKQLGITETGDAYEMKSKKTVAEFIQKEAEKKDLPRNVLDGIGLKADADEFIFPLEALSNYRSIKSIIYSIVDKKLLRPKISGGPKVQVSSTLFEQNNRQAVYKPAGDTLAKWTTVTDYDGLSDKEKETVRLTSTDLKFYTRDEPWIEVYVPHWFKEKLKKSGSNKTDKELIEYLEKNKSGLLSAIGFRIPTQELNSVENIQIKGFLPQEMGDTIIVPSAIVTKAGSDFDIDKLNTYLKNYFINKEGFPQEIAFVNADLSDLKGQQRLYNHFFGSLDNFLRMVHRELAEESERGSLDEENKLGISEESSRLINNIFGDLSSHLADIGIDQETYEKKLSKYISFEKFQELISGKDIYQVYAEFDPEALENEYINTLSQLLSLPQNFERLIQPNSAEELKELRDELNQAMGRPSLETKGNFSLLLDPNYMSEVRHNFLAGKGGVGIAAIQQTNTALAQLSGLILDHRAFESRLTATERVAVDQVTVMLPHNTVVIDDQPFISISAIKDTIGRYISDKISAYINGYVDVAKDAFIVELGANINVARIYMFLEKIGVPTRDVIMFMNQPIIQDYLRMLSVKGMSAVHSEKTIKIARQIRALYPVKAALTGQVDTTQLKSQIEKRRDKVTFTAADNAYQQQILNEFLKYAVFSDHLFALTRGSNYDTDNFSDASVIFRKQTLTEQARQNNLFNSVDKVLNNSFIGNLAKYLSQLKIALGNIFQFDNDAIRPVFEQMLSFYLPRGKAISEDDYLTVASKLQSSLLDYITQLSSETDTASRIRDLMIGDNSVANELVRLKKSLPKDSDLGSNIILELLEPYIDNTSPDEPRNIKLTEKAYDSFTSNLYTEAMRELRNNVHTASFYRRLVDLALLQSGSRRSPISFTDIIPLEDYAPKVSLALEKIPGSTILQDFAANFAFQRVHFWDDRVVPTVDASEKSGQLGTFVPLYEVPERLYTNLGVKPSEYRFIKLNTHYQAAESNYPVVKIREIAINPATRAPYTISEQAEMRKNGDYSFFSYKLFQKVMVEDKNGDLKGLSYISVAPNMPESQNYIYKQINAWGKPGLVQEYYSYPRPSVIGSNVQVQEFSDNQVIAAFRGQDKAFLQLSEQQGIDISPSRASSDTLEKVYNFLNKIGVSVSKVRQITVNGQVINANAIADIVNKTIQIVHGRHDQALTEEAMHFAVELIEQKNPALFRRLLNEIGSYNLYKEILSQYGTNPFYQNAGRPDIIKLKKEAIARVLVEVIIRKNEDISEKPQLLARTLSWWEKIIEFLKNLFSSAGFNPFETAAGIIDEDLQDADFSENEGLYFQQDSFQNRFINNLLNIHRQISKEVSATDSSDSYYMIAGKRVLNRVTNLAKAYYDRKFRNKQISETELQRAINDQKKEKGTDGHSDLEDIFHRMVDDDGYLRDTELPQSAPSRLDPNDNTYYKTLENNLRQRLHGFKAGTRFFSEVMIYDKEKDMAGTIDFLAVEPDNPDGTQGKIHILDWKFINLREDATDIPFYKKEAWNIQVSEYGGILVKPMYGASKNGYGMTRAIPIKNYYTYSDNERTKLKLFGLEIGNANVELITDDTLLPVPTRHESTGNKDLDGLIYSLNSLHDKIYETRSDPGTEYLKNQRLDDITIAIRRLQLKKETATLFKFAKNDIYSFNSFFRKYFELLESGSKDVENIDVNELSGRILDAEDVLTLYKDFNVIFRKIFSFNDATEKAILQESEMISDDAELVLSRLLKLANSLRVNPIARGLEVEDMLEPEQVVTWYQKWVRSLSQGPTKASELLWGIVNRINTKVQLDFSEKLQQLQELEKRVLEWIQTSGKTFKDLQEMIFNHDAKGRWNGKVISTTDSRFYTAMADALSKKNKSWVMDNIDVGAYKLWYEGELAKRKAGYETSRLLEDDQADAALKIARLNDFKNHFDIMSHPDTAITSANYMLKSFPDLDKWISEQYKILNRPENAAVLELYNHWQEKLEQSYKLGMIKSWEQKTFFPNVRKDFLDKLVFGAKQGIIRSANLAFLNNIRIETNDEVFGYTDINGNPQDKLSALYLYDLGEKIIDKDGEEFTDYSNKSTDLFKVMALWTKEMIKYQHKSQVIDTVRLLHFTEKNRKAIARSKRTGGIAYKEDGEPVLIDNVENSTYFKNYMDYYFYSKKLSEGPDVTFHFRYNNLAQKVNNFFGADLMPASSEEIITVSGRKMIRAFNRFFQMKVLGFNLATAVTNMVGGKVNAYMLAGKFFTKADYAKGLMQLSSAKFHTQQGKIYAGLLDYFLPLTDDRTNEQIKGLSVSRAVKLFSSDHLFYMMRTSDKMVQYPVALAMFSNTMIEDGKFVNIREHVKQLNGYANIYQLTASEQQLLRNKIEQEIETLKATRSLPVIARIENDKVVFDGLERNDKTVGPLRNRIQQFSKDALGNMSEEDISQYRLSLLGQSFMMFKNWIPRMADVRFGEFRYQAGTDSYEWGRISMLFNALKFGVLSGAKASLATLTGSNKGLIEIARKVYAQKKAAAESSGGIFKMTEADFIDMYIKGIRSQLKEVALMMAMLGTLLFAKSEVPDDDDERTSGAYKWLTRTLDKMTDELGFFLNPLSFTAIANGSVFPSVQLLNDIVKFVGGMTLESYYLSIGDEDAAKKNQVVKYLFKTFPVTKEMLTYVAMFNEDLAAEYGITINTNSRIR